MYLLSIHISMWWWCSSLSVVSDSVTLWTVALQAPLSMGFSRQEYWSGLPFPSSGDLPDPGIGPESPALQVDFFTPEHQGSPRIYVSLYACLRAKSLQSCSTFCDTMDHIACQATLSMGILQTRILEWVAVPSSRGSSQPRDQTQVSHIAGRSLTT